MCVVTVRTSEERGRERETSDHERIMHFGERLRRRRRRGKGREAGERKKAMGDCFQVPVPPPDIFLCVCQKKCGNERVHVGRCE